MEEAARLCDRVAIIDHGRFLAIGAPNELIASLDGREIIEFRVVGEIDQVMLLNGLPGVKAVDRKNESYSLKVESIDVTLPALLNAVEKNRTRIDHLLTRQATLEDVFISMTGGGRLIDE